MRAGAFFFDDFMASPARTGPTKANVANHRQGATFAVGGCRSPITVVVAQAITNNAVLDYWVHWPVPQPPVPGDRSKLPVVERAKSSQIAGLWCAVNMRARADNLRAS